MLLMDMYEYIVIDMVEYNVMDIQVKDLTSIEFSLEK